MKKFVFLFLIPNLVYRHNPNNHINQHNIINPSYRSTLGDINNDGSINNNSVQPCLEYRFKPEFFQFKINLNKNILA